MIVVTGGAGFIGSCFVAKLNEHDIDDVLIVDELGIEHKWRNLTGLRYADIEHKDNFLSPLLAGEYGAEIEAIFHFGACSATTERDADYLLRNNYAYSKTLAEYAEARNIRFIYASSGATYGAGERGYDDRVYESLRPLNMYGYSKHLFDLWTIRNGLDSKFVGLKFFNVFGPNEYHKGDMASLVYKAFGQITERGSLRLFKSHRPEYADGEQQRDFIYVKDACQAVWNIFRKGEVSGILNIGTGKARSWNDLARAVFSAMGREPNIEYIDMPESIRDQYQYFTEADMSKFQSTRAGLTFRELEDTVGEYVRDYMARGYRHIGAA